MAESQAARQKRGMSTMSAPRRIIAAEHASFESRFGAEFASRVTRGSWLVVVGAWVMVIGLIGMIITAVIVFFATGSLPAMYGAMYGGFGVIIVGFVLSSTGRALRSGPIRDLSARIISFNPNVTPEGASHLIRDPQLYARWMAQHPGFADRQT